jgi:hypothetical protein
MKAIIKPVFEIDVSDWYEDERLTKKEKIAKLKEDLSDFSVFMIHCDYEVLKDIKVIIN